MSVFLHIIYIYYFVINYCENWPIIFSPDFVSPPTQNKQQAKHEPENIRFFDCIKLVSLSKSIAGMVQLENQSAVKVVQKYVFASKMGFQITHKAATCEHTC